MDRLTRQFLSNYLLIVGKRLRDLNMVAAAVRMAGSKLGAADRSQDVKLVSGHLNVTRAAVYQWIAQRHMRRAALETAITLSDLSGVSVRDLAAFGSTKRHNDYE
jgi:hypothetical protein